MSLAGGTPFTPPPEEGGVPFRQVLSDARWAVGLARRTAPGPSKR